MISRHDTDAVDDLHSAGIRSHEGADPGRLRQRISHDIYHELATIKLLAQLLMDAPELAPESHRRARLIVGETRWLEQLQRAYDGVEDRPPSRGNPTPPVRVDEVCAEVVDAMRLATLGRIHLTTEPVSARVTRLTLWRALRNVLDNAVRAAGPNGTVTVAVGAGDGWATVQIDDDGPGFGRGDGGRSALGLHIVQEFVAAAGGQFEIRRGLMGGCCVVLQIPECAADELGSHGGREPS